MKQIIVIHGGTTFPSYTDFLQKLQTTPLEYDRLLAGHDWKATLASEFPDADVLLPKMPNAQNAQYTEWKMMFEKIIPFFQNDVTLIGHSLGALFLAKYLHEHPLKQPVRRLVLVAAPYADESGESLGDFLLSDVKNLPASAHEIDFFFSTNDPIVSISEMDAFQADLPEANYHVFNDRFHFWQESFPELVELLKK